MPYKYGCLHKVCLKRLVSLPESFLINRIEVFNGFCVFTEPCPAKHVHVFTLNQVLYPVHKKLQNKNYST